MLKKFMIGNTILMGCALIGSKIYIRKRNEEIYKNTRVFDLAMRTLRSNEGAVHFLGEPITDGRLTVSSEKKDGNITIYHVKVGVKGDKAMGCMNFWLRRIGEEDDPELTRIELQIQNVKNRLLIRGENNPVQAKENNAKS